jgi:hypothetical protein
MTCAKASGAVFAAHPAALTMLVSLISSIYSSSFDIDIYIYV